MKKFEEISHSADAALRVFGENKVELFVHAVEGMFHLMGLKLEENRERKILQIVISEDDLETLLVSFLTEVLFHVDKGIGFDRFDIKIIDSKLKGKMIGNKVDSYDIQIKAVTFNELKIKKENLKFETLIVFDV